MENSSLKNEHTMSRCGIMDIFENVSKISI